jgi:hypothetical protein
MFSNDSEIFSGSFPQRREYSVSADPAAEISLPGVALLYHPFFHAFSVCLKNHKLI